MAIESSDEDMRRVIRAALYGTGKSSIPDPTDRVAIQSNQKSLAPPASRNATRLDSTENETAALVRQFDQALAACEATRVRRTASQRVQEEWIYELRSKYSTRNAAAPVMFVGGALAIIAGAAACAGTFAEFGIGLTAGLAALAVGACMVMNGTSKLLYPLRWYCPNSSCGKLIHAKLPWRCAYCNHVNEVASLVDRCGNPNCRTPTKSMECPHCDTLLFLDRDNDGRHPARRKGASVRPVPRRDEAARIARNEEIEERVHERKKLTLDIDLAQLRLKLNPPKPSTGDRRQERMDRMFNSIEDAVLDCNTLQQTMVKEKHIHADIDANPDLDESQKNQMKTMVSLKFDDLRYELSRNVRS